MPVTDEAGLRIFDKSDLRFERQVAAAKILRAKRKAKRERAEAEANGTTHLYLRKPLAGPEQTVQEWVADMAYKRQGKFTRIDDGAMGGMVNGYCKDISYEEWQHEFAVNAQRLNEVESQIEKILAGIGYYATISQAPSTGQVWVCDLHFDPESRREEGRLIRATSVHETQEHGLVEILDRVGFKSFWEPNVGAYLIEPDEAVESKLNAAKLTGVLGNERKQA
ncbi:MAG: hypothetical protein KF713_11220 [Turneriella sp.]|nr:hypothetical protein [Turneriella sp.]